MINSSCICNLCSDLVPVQMNCQPELENSTFWFEYGYGQVTFSKQLNNRENSFSKGRSS